MITEDYVSFETAKLLKEKGFDEPCDRMWLTERKDSNWVKPKRNSEIKNECTDCVQPSHSLVMKWLRIEHNIHIEILMTNHSMSERFDIPKYYWVAVNAKTCKWISESTVYSARQFDTNEEACEAAIKCCLENLMNK